jgi:DNA-directed RNA polymerase subunit RPC12/RpoP
MRCIYCGADSRLRDRSGGRCPRCRHRFAFEPTTDRYKVTDSQFQNAVDRVSGGGKVQFTARHLWYEFNRRWMAPRFWRSRYGALVGAVTVGTPVLLGALDVIQNTVLAFPLSGAVAGSVAVVVLRGVEKLRPSRPPRAPRIPPDVFGNRYLARWRDVHGEVAAVGLLPARQAALPAMPREVPADVSAFSFDRAVVTDRWETAQMLVANRFHFEHNCAVLSVDGYPDGIADTVKEMLRRNPRLTVFALHDASVGGCMLPLTLREPAWFPDPAIRVVDLGLRPGTARRARIPALAGARAQVPPRLAEILSAEDVAWLARGHVAELAALRPEQVLRAAYRGIVAAGPGGGSDVSGSGGDSGGGGGDTYYGGGVIWVGDLSPGADTAAVDGFG